jgi:tRNA (guanine-N7-)-methyltransferase
MSRKKLARFAELKEMKNVLEFPEGMKGNWHKFFKNKNPITLELGCGRGEYTLGLAKMYPKRNFIGIDIQGERLWYGSKEALEEDISNAAFLRIQIENITDYFKENEVSEIWITFPDPHPKKGSAKKRLTALRFLACYKDILKPKSAVYLKTDSRPLLDYSVQTMEEAGFSREKKDEKIFHSIQTAYEKKYRDQGKEIHCAKWKLP